MHKKAKRKRKMNGTEFFYFMVIMTALCIFSGGANGN